MKKISMFLLVMFLFILGACGNDSGADADSGAEAAAGDEAELTVWAWDPNFNLAALEIAKEFYAEENPDSTTTIEILETAQDDVVQQLNIMLSAGTEVGLPNIVLIEDLRAQTFLQAFPDAFYDMSSYINSDDFTDYKVSLTSFEGRQYGVPFDSGVTGFYIRTDYLEEAGFTTDDLMNIDWNELIEIGKVILEETGKPLMTVDPTGSGFFRKLTQSAGAWYVQEDGETPYIAENEALKAAFQVQKDLLESGVGMVTTDWGDMVGAFNNGDVVGHSNAVWITPSIMQEETQSGDWSIVTHPRLPGVENAVNASNVGGSSWFVLNIDGREEAAEFLASTFGSNEDFYQRLLEDVGAMGSFIPAIDGEAYQMEVEFFGGQQIFSDFATWSKDIPQITPGNHTHAIEDVLVVAFQEFLNGQDLDQVLANAEEQVVSQILN